MSAKESKILKLRMSIYNREKVIKELEKAIAYEKKEIKALEVELEKELNSNEE